MILNFLGTGNFNNIADGNTSAYFKEDNKLFLIDCGEMVFTKILKVGLLNGIEDVHILITHLHSDHVGSLSSLIYHLYYMMGIRPTLYYPNKDIINFLSFQGNTNINCFLRQIKLIN
jgi:ribonuclease BN (tRNA processing enzyme)